VQDVFSQHKNELTVALGDDENDWMVRGSVQRPTIHLFRVEGYSKARRNVATLLTGTIGRQVTAVRIADRDRLAGRAGHVERVERLPAVLVAGAVVTGRVRPSARPGELCTPAQGRHCGPGRGEERSAVVPAHTSGSGPGVEKRRVIVSGARTTPNRAERAVQTPNR
jgi:hypothetical protein